MAPTTDASGLLNATIMVLAGVSSITSDVHDVTSAPDGTNGTITDLLAPGANNTEVVIWEYKLSLLVQAYAGFFIILLGVTGNIIVIAVMTYKGETLAFRPGSFIHL